MVPAELGPDVVDDVVAVVDYKVLDELEAFHEGKVVEACRSAETLPSFEALPDATTVNDPAADDHGENRERECQFFVETHRLCQGGWPNMR